MISIIQSPLQLNPTNSDHTWSIISTNTGYTDFRYIVDIYTNPFETYSDKVARLKIAPNSYGVGIFDVRNILINYFSPNIRSEANNYYQISSDNWVTLDLQTGTIPLVSGFTQSNSYNETQPYENIQSFGSYRLVLGEQYTSGGTTTLNISSSYFVPQNGMVEYLDIAAAAYGGTPNRVNFTAGTYNSLVSPSVTGITSGYTYLHTQSNGTFVASGTSTASTGNYVAASQPSNNDLFYVWENSSGCGFYFSWNCDTCETSGWNYVGTYCISSVSIGQSPNPINVWPGTLDGRNRQMGGETSLGQINNNYKNYLVDRFELTNLVMSPVVDEYDTSSNFLTQRGTSKKVFETSGITISNSKKSMSFKHRQHHRNCPIVVSFMNGNLGQFQNQVSNLVELQQTGSTLNYKTSHALSYTGTTSPLAYTNPDDKITYFSKWIWGTNELENVNKVGFYTAKSGTSTNYTTNGTSEILVYELYGDECLQDPIHFAFVNRNGVVDTLTFSQKNILTKSTKKDIFAQSGIRNSTRYVWQDYQQRNIVYNQDLITRGEAQSMFVDENDVPIYTDLFMSPYVWVIDGMEIKTNAAGEEYVYPYLIPVFITSNSVEEYKSRFNKLFQYDITFEYNTIEQLNSPL